jgi:hypothetical protein
MTKLIHEKLMLLLLSLLNNMYFDLDAGCMYVHARRTLANTHNTWI